MSFQPPPTLAQRLAPRERPSSPVVMFQRWEQLLFLHWKWDADEIQARLPAGLYTDTFDGAAWIGIVPFYMRGIRPRFCPCVPGISNFLEMNVRTYVFDEQGRPGVWFFSLDCNQPIAVQTARTFFRLPYRHASMTSSLAADGTVNYHSHLSGGDAASEFRYRIEREATFAEPETLEFFLAERYLLFAKTPNGLRCGQVHHTPYPLGTTSVDLWTDRPLAENRFGLPGRPPDHITGSIGVSVSVHPLTK